ncbi:B12-binding domain-containing radical SAM protein [Methanonatronarchaeum thermophilum]|nr:radical SAM protein [Methanonatronarchaeum thermophilum]
MTTEVLLINPPDFKSKYKKYFNIRAPPLGIAYIASVLDENDIDVVLMDCAAEDIGYDEMARKVGELDPFLVGVTSTTPLIPEALRSIQVAKEASNAYTVLGGPHPTFMHEDILNQNESVDFVVKGEGEYTVLDLYQTLREEGDLSNVEGIVFRSEGRVVENEDRALIEDLDSLPYPARHLLPTDKYVVFDDRMSITTMVCSRGCPMQCSFCASSALHGKAIRKRSPTDVVDEMEHVKETLDVSTIAFMDDTFTLLPDWVREFCRELKDRDIDIGWGCTARVDKIDRDMIELMRDAGCHTIFIGVESGNQEILDRVKKGTQTSQVKKIFETANDVGMRTVASLAIGLPGETRETVNRSIQFVKDIKANYALFSIATPYPGTEFYNNMKDIGKIKGEWGDYDLFSPVVETTTLTLEEIHSLQKQAFKEFYLRPTYIMKNLVKEGVPFFKVMSAILKQSMKQSN